MPRQNLYIARRIYTSLEFVHREKDPCLVENQASRKKSCIASQQLCTKRRIHALSKNFHIARRFYSSLIVMHREKIHFSRKFTYRGKIFMPRKRTYLNKERAILIHWPRLHSVISHKNKHHGEHRRWQQKKHQYRISIYLFISTSSMEYVEDDIAKHKA